jgi:hypothetical protein
MWQGAAFFFSGNCLWPIFQLICLWAVSSAVEHLVYTEGAGGSIPSPPTIAFILKVKTMLKQ